MKTNRYLAGLLAVLFIVFFSLSAYAEQSHEINGKLTYPDGTPAANIHIKIYYQCKNYPEVETDSNGNYRATVQNNCVNSADIVSFYAQKDDYILSDYVSVPKDSKDAVQKDLKFEYAVLLIGEVTDASTKKPIEGAKVSAFFYYCTTTGNDGLFKLRIPHSDHIMMSIEKDDYVTKRIDFSAQTDTSAWRVQLKPGGTIKGRVIYNDGTPAVGVNVWVSGEDTFSISGKTDKDGYYEIKNVNTDASQKVYGGSGCNFAEPVEAKFAFGSKETKVKDMIAVKEVVRTITGKITDDKGNPIKDANVGFGGMFSGRTTKTNADGEYKIGRAGIGRDFVLVQADGYAPEFTIVNAGSDQNVDVKLSKAHAAEVQLLDASGKPMPNAQITVCAKNSTYGLIRGSSTGVGIKNDDIYRWLYVIYTDSNGKAVLKNLPAEGTVLDTDAQPMNYISIRVDSTDNVIKQSPSYQIAGVVVDAQTNAPISPFTIKWMTPGSYYPSGVPHMAFNGPDGRFSIGVENGQYTVKVLADGYVGDNKLIASKVTTDTCNQTVFKLQRAISIKGKITDTSGKAVSGAEVRVIENGAVEQRIIPLQISTDAYQQRAITDKNGSFTITPAKERTATVVVEKSGYPMLVKDEVDLTKPVDLSLTVPAAVVIKAAAFAKDGGMVDMSIVKGCYWNDVQLKDPQIPKSGTAVFSDLEPGYYVTVIRGKNRTELRAFSIKSGEKYVIDLDKKQPVTIEGTVTKGGKPVAGCSVTVERQLNVYSSSVSTDDQGRYKIAVDKPGQITPKLGENEYPQVNLKPGKNICNIKIPTGSISGHVYDSATGQPLEGIGINAISKRSCYYLDTYDPFQNQSWGNWVSSTTSAKDGSFTLENIPSDEISVRVSNRYQRDMSSGLKLEVDEKKPVKDVNIKISEPGTLIVEPIDSKTGKKIRARVDLLTSYGDGMFVDNFFETGASVPAGKYIMWLYPDEDYFPAYANVEVISGKTEKVTVKLKPAGQHIVFKVPKGGKFNDLQWPEPNYYYGRYRNAPWIGITVRDAKSGRAVFAGPKGHEWNNSSDFDINRKAFFAIKPGTYILDAVMRNSYDDYNIKSKDNLWKTHRKIIVLPGKDVTIEIK